MTEQNSAPSIVLNQDILSKECLADIQKYFGTQSIEIISDQLSPRDPQIYQGTGTLLNVNCQIEALHKEDQSLLILCAQPNPNQNWNFGTCFPLMPGSTEYLMLEDPEPVNSEDTFLLRFISLQSPLWIYCYSTFQFDAQTLQAELTKLHVWQQWSVQNHPTLPAENGLYLWGGLASDISGLKELTKFIEINDLSPFLVQTRVTFPDNFPVLTLHLPLGVDEHKFGTATLKKAAIELSSPLYFSPNNSQISLRGALDLNDGKEIDIIIDFPLDSDLITATGTYSDTSIPFVAASDISDFPSLQPKEAITLELEFSKREKTLEKVEFSIDLDNWNLIPNILTLKELSFTFSVFDPLSSKMVIASIAAQASLGSKSQITLLCSGYYPTNQFYLSLDSKTPLKIADLVVDLGAQSDGIPDLSIDDLSAEYNLNSQDFLTRVDVAGKWNIIEGFELNRLRFKIYGRDTYSCEILAEFTIAGVTLKLEADYDNGGGWQFKGNTGYGQTIPIGTLIADLGNKFGKVTLPLAIAELTIQNLGISFNTKTHNFTFTCEAKFPIEGKEVDITININITNQQDNSYKKHFDGYITIGDLKFALIFDTDQTSKTFLAAYNETTDNEITVKNLIGSISPTLQNDIPEGLTISIKDALFAYQKQDTQTNFLFCLDIGSGINLSSLPLVGKEFSPDQTIKLVYQVLVAKANFSQAEITHLNALYAEGGISLPQKDITNRLDLSTSMRFGQETKLLSLPVEINQESGQLQQNTQSPNTVPSSANVTSPDDTKWYQLQKAFGPVHFERVGVQYKDGVICFLLDAAVSAAGLTLSLDGLSVNSPLTKFEPKFDLKGIGIDYRGGDAIEIGGAFLRKQVTKGGQTYDEYDGAAIIKAKVKDKAFTLSAIGSYASVHDHPSLFIYAILDYPIGGPSFFFVTGLAAGFGYNRALLVPPIEQVATFPLIAEAITPNPSTDSNQDQAGKLTQELEKLQNFIPPEPGQTFLAVGVRFTSFKIIDSFALLTVAFGNRFEINILGLSTLIAPPEAGKTPIAEVQLALKASFLPEQGFLGVCAQLTSSSYIFSKACHLTGGAAFYSWFAPNEHEGEFVVTIGGYHPLFNVPDYYPTVPRLALNWQVNDELQIKADGYFALTASVLMAGGHLQATWNSGDLSAWFNAGADFIITWKPYHYDASIYVDMGVSYTYHFFGTHHISVDVGADLHIWGPEFSGIAHIHLWIVSFDVRFGEDASQKPDAIDWKTFKSSFLPAESDICSITIKDGLVRKVNPDDKTELGVINSKYICLVINTVIPAKDASYQQGNNTFPIEAQGANKTFGIASMAISSDELSSTLFITISKDEKPLTFEEFQEEFTCTPLFKKVPTGLWGKPLTRDLNDKFIEGTLSGFEIKPKKQHQLGETHAIDRSQLQFSTETIDNAYRWENIQPFIQDSRDAKQTIKDTIIESSTARNDLLAHLGIDPKEVDLSSSIAEDFLISPQIEKASA